MEEVLGSKKTAGFLTRLRTREIDGRFFRRSFNKALSAERPFEGELPSRLSLKLSSILPESALESGVVFLGFSRCGRFLLTYAQSSELNAVRSAQGLNYVYHLQWWLFRMGERAMKIAEVQLFGEFVIWHPLYLSISEWPSVSDFVVVFGYDKLEEGMMQGATCYVTVTAFPSTNGCEDCLTLRKNLGEEFYGCDSGDVLPHAQCLRHGLTVHTSCSVVPPFPKSNPLRLLTPNTDSGSERADFPRKDIRPKSVRMFVLSTGNFIHAFKIEILDPTTVNLRSKRQQHPLLNMFSPPSRWPGSPSVCSQERAPTIETLSDKSSIAESVEVQDERDCNNASICEGNSRPVPPQNTPPASATTSPRKPVKFFANRGVAGRTDDAYAFVDESPPANENLNSFRRKRLAERTYEFSDDLVTDENTEASLSIAPWSRRLREPRRAVVTSGPSSTSARLFQIRSPASSNLEALSVSVSVGSDASHPMAVLRQLNHCPSSHLLLSPRELREFRESTESLLSAGSLSPASSDHSGPTWALPEKRTERGNFERPRKKQKTRATNNPWVAEFTRYYMDVDDELVSVFSTDFDDDELCSSTGYHNALPLEVHGSAYGQMQQISRGKVGRVGAPIVVFDQISMDMEEFCHKMAEKICEEAGEKFWSCEDYDVSVLQENWDDGSLFCCAEMLVRTKPNQTRPLADTKLFETGLHFEWHPWNGSWSVVNSRPLAETPDPRGSRDDSAERSIWLPAQTKLRMVNKYFHRIPKNTNALPRRLDNLPVLQEKSLEFIREPSLGIEVRLRTKTNSSLLSDDDMSDVNTSFASDSDDN